MKNVISKTILATAALAISMSPALAQGTSTLRAKVPFAFRVGNQVHEAGTYTASTRIMAGGARVLEVVNRETGSNSYVLAISSVAAKTSAPAQAETRLVFSCAGSDCTLAQVWMRDGEPGIQLRTPGPKPGQEMHMAEIRLLPNAAD